MFNISSFLNDPGPPFCIAYIVSSPSETVNLQSDAISSDWFGSQIIFSPILANVK
jgi:hypothetical protein